MKNLRSLRGNRGFTLVEILTVLVMVGIFMSAAYGVYISNQRTAYSQEEVSEVQQNLRVGMDQLSRDLLMAGLLAKSEAPVTGTSDTLSISLASSNVRNARIVEALDDDVTEIVLPAGSTAGTFDFPVSSYDDRDVFKAGDFVRIVSPQDGNDPYQTNVNDAAHPEKSLLQVDGVGAMASSELPDGEKVPRIRLKFAGTAVAPTLPLSYKPGNLIVPMPSAAAPFPNTIAYALNADGELVRTVNGGISNVVAEKISAVAFEYLLDDGSVVTSPAVDEFKSVRAVRVTLTGQTEKTNLTDGISKVRQLVATCGIRNRGADKGR